MSPSSIPKRIIRSKANDNAYETETIKPKSKFSNNTLVVHNAIIEPVTSELTEYNTIKQRIANGEILADSKSPLNEDNLNYNLCLTKYKSDISPFGLNKPKTNKNRLQVLQCEQNTTTLMPNTSEFEALSLNRSAQKSMKFPRKCLEPTPSYTSKSEPSYWSSIGNWRIIFVILWYFSFTGVMIYMIAINIANSPVVTENHEHIILEPTNYEIVLLICRNFRRLIVSSIPSFH